MSTFLKAFLLGSFAILSFSTSSNAHGLDSAPLDENNYYVQLQAKTKFDRSRITDLGVSIDFVMSDSVYASVNNKTLLKLKQNQIKIIEQSKVDDSVSTFDFPKNDSRFHNYERMTQALDHLVADHPNLFKKWSIGKTIENRDIWVVQMNSGLGASRPGAIIMGNHHAREHVSAEIPLMLLEFFAKNYGVDRDITNLVDKRDVYFIPMVNPDGVEYDIESGRYKSQRKNMHKNGTSKPGVDLNRNYGYQWGTGGASSDPSNETYRGEAAFSEPETQAIKMFVESKPNVKCLLTFHTFSELILYPWGHKYEPVEKTADRQVFENMARTMAKWNNYKPQQSSELYIASGDTTDWAYGTLGIFAFTFELSPRSMWRGGFYPGEGVLDKVFEDNLKPSLYLIEMADDPYRANLRRDERLNWLM